MNMIPNDHLSIRLNRTRLLSFISKVYSLGFSMTRIYTLQYSILSGSMLTAPSTKTKIVLIMAECCDENHNMN